VKALAALVALLALALPAGAAAAPPTQTPGELVVGLNLGEPGFEVGAVQGTRVVLARGFEIDLARLLAQRLGIAKVTFLHEPAFSKLYAAGAKPWDLALAEVTITPARSRNVAFSTPYLAADQGVLVAQGVTAPTTIAGLRPLQLCAQRGTTSVAAVTSLVKPEQKVLLFDKQEGLLDALYQRRCQAVVDDAPLLAVLRKDAPGRYGPLAGTLGTAESYGVVLPKGSALVPDVDRALAALAADGSLARLQKRWLGADVSKLRALT
jgi:polar amino acid transport system substrate-binding protein